MERIRALELQSGNDKDMSNSWREAVLAQYDILDGVSPFSGPEHSQLIHKTLAPNGNLITYIADIASRPAAILPCILSRSTFFFLQARTLTLAANLYPARAGIIANANETDAANRLIRHVVQSGARYDTFHINVTKGSYSENVFLRTLSNCRPKCILQSEQDVAYIEFPESWDTLFAGLPKKFRYTIRSCEAGLRKLGELSLAVFSEPDECGDFLRLIESIERKSWKEEASTSLTQNPTQMHFHTELATLSARRNDLYGYVLMLDSEPIAYVYSIRHGNVLLDLKESFCQNFAKFSPGTVLKAKLFERVIGSGIEYWDFGGKAESHKLKWTSKTYTIRSYTCFNRTLVGNLLRIRHAAGQRIKTLLASSATSPA